MVRVTRSHRAKLRPTVWVALVAILIAALVTGCGSSKPAGGRSSSSVNGTASSGGAHTVLVKNFSFNPETLTVPVGTAVTWRFEDSVQHTVSDSTAGIKSAAPNNGQTFTHTFTTAGTYSYICSIHQYMKATIVVQ